MVAADRARQHHVRGVLERAERYQDKTGMPYSSHSVALNVIRAARPRTVLDIGCGPGHVAARCREMGARVVQQERPTIMGDGEFLAEGHFAIHRGIVDEAVSCPLPNQPRQVCQVGVIFGHQSCPR